MLMRRFSFSDICPAISRLAFAVVTIAALPVIDCDAAFAQTRPVPQAAPVAAVPGFWDPRRRPERPDTSRLTVIRFLTETDYPPFNYAGADGNPTGFNVDLARAICDELQISCTDPDAPLRYACAGACRKSRRRADRLDLGHTGDAQDSAISAIRIIACRRVS